MITERNDFRTNMDFTPDGRPYNERYFKKVKGSNSWWLSRLMFSNRVYECTHTFWIAGPSDDDVLRFIFHPGFRFDGPTMVESLNWKRSLWWPFAACHDQPYKNRKQFSEVKLNGEPREINRARADRFFRDGLIAFGEPKWAVWAAFKIIRKGGSVVWGSH